LTPNCATNNHPYFDGRHLRVRDISTQALNSIDRPLTWAPGGEPAVLGGWSLLSRIDNQSVKHPLKCA
jgi:hypothetical protein